MSKVEDLVAARAITRTLFNDWMNGRNVSIYFVDVSEKSEAIEYFKDENGVLSTGDLEYIQKYGIDGNKSLKRVDALRDSIIGRLDHLIALGIIPSYQIVIVYMTQTERELI